MPLTAADNLKLGRFGVCIIVFFSPRGHKCCELRPWCPVVLSGCRGVVEALTRVWVGLGGRL